MRSRRIVGLFVLLAGCLFHAVLLGTEKSSRRAPVASGASIEMRELDSRIGPEWDDAARQPLILEPYAATALLKHDGERLYLALIIETGRKLPGVIEGFVVFDNGDGHLYAQGDDMIAVPAQAGQLLEADYTYRGPYDFVTDRSLSGQINAHGAGRYNPDGAVYVFEFVKDLAPDGCCDVDLTHGLDVLLVVGWSCE